MSIERISALPAAELTVIPTELASKAIEAHLHRVETELQGLIEAEVVDA